MMWVKGMLGIPSVHWALIYMKDAQHIWIRKQGNNPKANKVTIWEAKEAKEDGNEIKEEQEVEIEGIEATAWEVRSIEALWASIKEVEASEATRTE